MEWLGALIGVSHPECPKDILKNCLPCWFPANDDVLVCQEVVPQIASCWKLLASPFQCEPLLKEFPLSSKHRIAFRLLLQFARGGAKSEGLWP
jgi:hypothetical protein